MDSLAPAAVVSWHVGNDGRFISSQSQLEPRADGWVSTRSSVRFPSYLYSGQNLSCLVEHRSMRAPEKRTILVEHSTFLPPEGLAAAGRAAVASRHLCLSFSRSPPDECVSAETGKLSSLDCGVRLQRAEHQRRPRLASARTDQEPNLPGAGAGGPVPESQADLPVQSEPPRGPEPHLCVPVRARIHRKDCSRPTIL